MSEGHETVTFLNRITKEPIHSMQLCHCSGDLGKGKTILIHGIKYMVTDFIPAFNGVKRYEVYLLPYDLYANILEIIKDINSL